MSHLDRRQRHALAQLQDLTHSSDDDVAISVLDSVGWDVQVCPGPGWTIRLYGDQTLVDYPNPG
jgi:hypothetical protein